MCLHLQLSRKVDPREVAITYVSNEAAAARVTEQLEKLGSRATAIRVDAADAAAGDTIVNAVFRDFDVDGIDILGELMP